VALTGQHIENHNPSWLFQPGLFYKDDLLQSIAE